MLITAIMPTTAKRRRLLPAAIRTFAQQTFTDATLLVGIDEGEETLVPIVREWAAANHVAERVATISTRAKTIGAKRNEMCAAIGSPWIAFWDDDDWHHPSRLALTAQAIAQIKDDGPEGSWIIGSRTMMIHEIIDPRRRTFIYRSSNPSYFVGGLLCFERSLWGQHPFPSMGLEANAGDDAWWQLKLDPVAVPRYEFTEDPGLYCAFIHTLNTSNRQAPQGDPGWKQITDETLPVLDAAFAAMPLWEDAHRSVLTDPLVTGRLEPDAAKGSL